MARTVLGSGTKYLPDGVETILILTDTTKGAGTLTPTLAFLTDTTTLEVQAAVADRQNWKTGRNLVSDYEWGANGFPFTIAGGRTWSGTPTIWFWADQGGDDIMTDLTEDLPVSVVIAPEGVAATDVVRIYAGSVAYITPDDSKGAIARVEVGFSIQSQDLNYVVPGA
jgi:hypothetical protein